MAADGVADGMHIISEEAQAAEEVVRAMDGVQISFIGLGVAIGAAIGGFIAFRLAYKKAEENAECRAEEEIAQMREHFLRKAEAREANAAKPELGTIVRDLGYTSEPPAPETPVVEVEPEEPGEVSPMAKVHNVFERSHGAEEPEIVRQARTATVWDYNAEQQIRDSLHPMACYVIHKDEVGEDDSYEQETLTYYEEDDVLTDARDEVLDQDDKVGLDNMGRFGHGSGDPNVVYVRNPELMVEFEIIKTKGSFAQVVHGFNPDEPEIRHHQQTRFRRSHLDDE